MTTAAIKVTAKFADGMFTPQQMVDLPENATFELTLKIVNGTEPNGLALGSLEAFDAYIEHLKTANYHFANRWDRDALYDRI